MEHERDEEQDRGDVDSDGHGNAATVRRMSDKEPMSDSSKGLMVVGYFVLAIVIVGLILLFLSRV